MARGSRKDDLRLKSILELLLEPFTDPFMEDMDKETQLYYVFRPSDYPIYKRRVLRSAKISGLWWVREAIWVKWMWQGHQGPGVRSGQEADKLLATRAIKPKMFCWVRDMGEFVDIEAMSDTTRWDAEKKRSTSGAEWLTVTITKAEYKRLDSFLGPVDDGCRHEEEKFEFNS